MWSHYTDQDVAKAHTFRGMHTSTRTVQNYCVRSADHSLSWHTYWKGNKENYSLDPHFQRWMTYWYSKQFFHVMYSGQEICIVHLGIRYATCLSFFCCQIIDATLWQLTRRQQLFAADSTLCPVVQHGASTRRLWVGQKFKGIEKILVPMNISGIHWMLLVSLGHLTW